jgi:excisionase family DNA binding protein
MEEVEPLTVSTNDAATMLGVGITTLHYLMKSGQLPRIKLGRRVLIRVADIHTFLDSLQSGTIKVENNSIRPK